MLAGTEVAHALAYRIVYPIASVRWQVLAATGHGYLGLFPLVIGVAGAIMLTGLTTELVDAARRRPPRPVPAWAFGVLPLVGFTLQEFLERWLAVGSVPWWMVEQPTFRVGLLLQLPFALIAFLVAHLLLRVVRRIGIALYAERPSLVAALAACPSRFDDPAEPSLSVLAGGLWVRGPPAIAAAPLLCP
jgi:hypothetical protein